MRYTLYYRGDISSCNYKCIYCPFSKNVDTKETLYKDSQDLNKFLEWIKTQNKKNNQDKISILFVPWGEALIYKWYKDVIIELSHLDNIEKIVIQTNLSTSLDWIKYVNKNKFAIWSTYHPDQTSEENFLLQCNILINNNVNFSVGAVGIKENKEKILSLRKNLNPNIYLWINAYRDELNYYKDSDKLFFENIDRYFQDNLNDYISKSKRCNAGETLFFIKGNGDAYRCNFIKEKILNIYLDDLNKFQKPSFCSNEICNCYIGYVNIHELNFAKIFGKNVLERIPVNYEKK